MTAIDWAGLGFFLFMFFIVWPIAGWAQERGSSMNDGQWIAPGEITGDEIPLTLNFGRRIGTARIMEISATGVRVSCELDREITEAFRQLGPGFLGEISFVVAAARPARSPGSDDSDYGVGLG